VTGVEVTNESATVQVIAAERLLRRIVAGRIAERHPGIEEDVLFGKDTAEALRRTREDERRSRPEAPDELSIFDYAGYRAIRTVGEKHWPCCVAKLKLWPSIAVLMSELGRLASIRNPGAHGREVLPHEFIEAEGIARRVRSEIERLRREEAQLKDEYWPYLEELTDSLGRVQRRGGGIVGTTVRVHEGDTISFQARGFDPQGRPLEYRWGGFVPLGEPWSNQDTYEWTAGPVGRQRIVCARMRVAGGAVSGGEDDSELCLAFEVRPRP
jgi:hypothetical protein